MQLRKRAVPQPFRSRRRPTSSSLTLLFLNCPLFSPQPSMVLVYRKESSSILLPTWHQIGIRTPQPFALDLGHHLFLLAICVVMEPPLHGSHTKLPAHSISVRSPRIWSFFFQGGLHFDCSATTEGAFSFLFFQCFFQSKAYTSRAQRILCHSTSF